MLLQAVIFDDVLMAQVLQQVDFIFNRSKFLLSLDSVSFLGQLDALDSKKATSRQIQRCVDLPERSLSNQVVLLVVN